MISNNLNGILFSSYNEEEKSLFEKLLSIFKELITHTSGDVDEALDWLKQLDEEYKITNESYTLENFIQELKDKGYISSDKLLMVKVNLKLLQKRSNCLESTL